MVGLRESISESSSLSFLAVKKDSLTDLDSSKLPVVPQAKCFDVGRLHRRKLRNKSCSRRGCLCHAPEPYSLFDGTYADEDTFSSTASLLQEKEHQQSTSSLHLPQLSTSTDWRSAKHACEWTRLHKKFTGEPIPLGEKRIERPKLARLAEGAVNTYVLRQSSSTIAESLHESNSADGMDFAGSPSSRASLRLSQRGQSFRRTSRFTTFGTPSESFGSFEGGIGLDPEVQAALNKRQSRLQQSRQSKLEHARQSKLFQNVEVEDTSRKQWESSIAEEIVEEWQVEAAKSAKNRIKRMMDKLKKQRDELALQRKYKVLPEAERESLEKAFIRFDVDSSGRLDWHEASSCLRDFGLMGATTKEKREVIRICQDQSLTAVSELDLKFGTDIIAKRNQEISIASGVPTAEKGASQAQLKDMAQKSIFSQAIIERPMKRVSTSSTGTTDEVSQFKKRSMQAEGLRAFNANLDEKVNADSDDEGFEESSEESGISFDFLSFAVALVPKVRGRLTEMRRNRILRYFGRLDKKGFGFLDFESCLEIGRCLGLDQLLFTASLAARGVTRDSEKQADFACFEKCIMSTREMVDRSSRERELRILQDTGISVEVFTEFRDIIGMTHEVFMQQPSEGTGLNRTIKGSQAVVALRELGLSPTTLQDRTSVEKLLKDSDEEEQKPHDDELIDEDDEEKEEEPEIDVSFEDFLNFIRKVRHYWLAKRHDELREKFRRLDKDRSESLSIEELTSLLEELGCLPQTRKEQEEMSQVITAVDADGSGEIDFEEFQDLIQRIEEKFAAVRYESELEYTLASGFSGSAFHELKDSFSMLDTDGSGALEAKELRSCLNLMNKPYTDESFELAFTEYDDDESGALDFMEFVNFMKGMRDQDGLFSDQTFQLPLRAKRLETRVIRMLLSHLNLSKSYLWSMDKTSLINLFYASFGITDEEPEGMAEALNVKSLDQLLQLAKQKGEASLVHLQGGRGDD